MLEKKYQCAQQLLQREISRGKEPDVYEIQVVSFGLVGSQTLAQHANNLFSIL